MQQGEIELQAFGPDHIEGAVALSRQENWPHRPQDWQMALQLSIGAVALDDQGRVTGTILVTPYGTDCAMINMVIVDRNVRGKGLGRRLMDQALALAGDRPLRLVATTDGMPLYEKLGFVPSGTILQHQGKVAQLGAPDGVEAAGADDLPTIKAMDRDAYGADREALIDALAERGQFAVIRRQRRHRGLCGDPPVRTRRGDRPGHRGKCRGRQGTDRFLRHAAPPAPSCAWIPTAGPASPTGSGEIGLAHVGGGVAMDRPPKNGAEQARPKVYALANQALGWSGGQQCSPIP